MIHRTRNLSFSVLPLALVTAVTAAPQGTFFEDFENLSSTPSSQHGPPELIAEGWSFRNQSEPTSSGDWTRWAYAYQGRWGLHVDQTVGRWRDDKSEISSWAVLPAIPGQVAGDEIRFFHAATQAAPLQPTAHLEIRYSPSGGTSTGSKADDVGAFTTLLADLPDPANPTFAEVRVAVPGPGRIAFRFHIPPSAAQSSFWGDFHLDNLSVGAAVGGPLLPNAGETVTWNTAMSPVQINELATIPAGGTVLIDPGVVVAIAPTASLTVNGNLIGNGLAGQPVQLQGDRIRVFGTLNLTQADVTARIDAMNAGSLTFRNVDFATTGYVFTNGSTTAPSFLDFDQCSFTGTLFRVGGCALRLTNTTFSSTYVEIGGSSHYLDNIAIASAPQGGINLLSFLQPVFLDNLSITGSAGAGIDLAAVNCLVGPNVTLTGNRYPADLGGGGFLPGTTLPTTGNTNNYVNVQDKSVGLIGGNPWSDVGIPYVVFDTYNAGRLDLLPGARIQLGPNATFWGVNQPVEARGTAADPVVFERFRPGQSWQGLQKFHRFENCIIDGGQIGARFNSSSYPGFIDDSVIRNCNFGTQNDVRVRKTQFINNAVGSWGDNLSGALDGAVGANSFVGNTVAVDSTGFLIDAANNWWNSPTGPTIANNPGGTGDVVLPGTRYSPFLTAAPDYDDHPPVVHLERHSGLFEPGSVVLLNWTSSDDVGVVSHRIEFDDPNSFGPPVIVAEGLPPMRKSFEWRVPDIGFVVSGKPPRIRVIATDTAGQEGWDAQDPLIPSGEIGGSIVFQNAPTGTQLAGATVPNVCWTPNGLTGGSLLYVSLVLDADRTYVPLGGAFSNCSLGSGLTLPFVSTDSARILVQVQGTTNRTANFYSQPFAIRPDPRVGDAAPAVQMLSPMAGDVYPSGGIVPISWTASDDEGLRSFSIQATYDAGHTWHFIVEDLPPTATQYQWRLPPSAGITDVRVRVIAFDSRFQNTSSGANRSFAIGQAGFLCQRNLGFAGPGTLRMSVCGQDLRLAGSTADLQFQSAPANGQIVVIVSTSSNPINVLGGTLVPLPALAVFTLVANGQGAATVPLTGGNANVLTLTMQSVALNGNAVEFSNALEVELGN